MRGSDFWTDDEDALALLQAHGGPFERTAFRQAHLDAIPGSRDVSYGAVAPDGTVAAIALIGNGRTADSVPPSGYGGIHASRPLSLDEEQSFLQAARHASGTLALTARALRMTDSAGRHAFATASVVHSANERSYSRLARRSLRKAETAGASARRSDDPAPFLELYAVASARWPFRYPRPLIERVTSSGAGILHHVEIDGEVVSSMLTLVDGSHWMCWLAAQNERGRALAASYVAYDAVLEEASSAVEFVNLGASAPGSGGAQFKSYLGAVDAPMVALRDSVPGWSAAGAASARLRRMRSRLS